MCAFDPFFLYLLRALGLFLADSAPTVKQTAVSQKRKVRNSIRRCEINRLAEGYKRAIDIIRGPLAKNGFLGRNPILYQNHVPAKTGQSWKKKMLTFSQINISLLTDFRCLLRTNGFSACGYQNFCSHPKWLGCLARKRPFLPQIMLPWAAVTYRPYRFIWCPVGWLVGRCGAWAVSRKTFIIL